jgi:hypothetical protein
MGKKKGTARKDPWESCSDRENICFLVRKKCPDGCEQCQRHCNCTFLKKSSNTTRDKKRLPLQDMAGNCKDNGCKSKKCSCNSGKCQHHCNCHKSKAMKIVGKENPPKVQREHRSNYDDVVMKLNALTLEIPCREEEVREIEKEVREDLDPLKAMLEFFELEKTKNFPGRASRVSHSPLDALTQRGLKVQIEVIYCNAVWWVIILTVYSILLY